MAVAGATMTTALLSYLSIHNLNALPEDRAARTARAACRRRSLPHAAALATGLSNWLTATQGGI